MLSLKSVIGLGAVIMILMVVLAIQQSRLEIAVTERDQAIQFSQAKDDSLVQLTTTLGQVTTRSEVQELTIRNLERLQADKELSWIKEIRGVNKKLNNVEQIMSTTLKAVATFKIGLQDTIIHLQPPDSSGIPSSIQAQFFDNENEWFGIRGYILPDTLVVIPEVYVPLNSIVYWERKKGFLGLRWFGRKEWFKQTTTPNPYVTITQDKLIRVSKRKPK